MNPVLWTALAAAIVSTAAATDVQVVVIGAGAAGISAAKKLMDHGITDFVVIDAQDYIGGRLRKETFAGKTVEVGGNWVHGNRNSPLYDRVVAAGMEGHLTDWDGAAVYDGSQMRSGAYDRGAFSSAASAMSCIWSSSPTTDRTLKAELSSRCGWNPSTPMQQVAEWATVDYDYAASSAQLGTLGMEGSEYCSGMDGDDFFIKDARGYAYFLEVMSQPFADKVMLSEVVTHVAYNDTSVTVTTDKGTYNAEWAISTVSNGVIAAQGDTLFSPPLPAEKITAATSRGMGVYTKIFLHFPSKFWGNTEVYFRADSNRGWMPSFHNFEAPGLHPAGTNILMLTLTSDKSAEFIAMSADQRKTEIMGALREMFGADAPDYDDILFHDWKADPYFRGSYSAPFLGSMGAQKAVRRPVGRLLFAGEATHPFQSSTVHGAADTGALAADVLAACQAAPCGAECRCARDASCDETAVMEVHGACAGDGGGASMSAAECEAQLKTPTAAPTPAAATTAAPTAAPTSAAGNTAAPVAAPTPAPAAAPTPAPNGIPTSGGTLTRSGWCGLVLALLAGALV